MWRIRRRETYILWMADGITLLSRQPGRRSLQPWVAIVLMAAILLVQACGSPSGPAGDSGAPDPADEPAAVRPGLMVVEPAQVAPGERVALTFPEQTLRGLAFVLQQQAEDGWQLRAYLTSAPGEGPPGEPGWYPPDAPPDVEDVGIVDTGPDMIRIPDEAEPGDYRICTMNAPERMCSAISIIG
jgi:hypothetical protein